MEKVRKLRDEFEGASAECLDKLEYQGVRGPGQAMRLEPDGMSMASKFKSSQVFLNCKIKYGLGMF